jgi:hypothetical protein
LYINCLSFMPFIRHLGILWYYLKLISNWQKTYDCCSCKFFKKTTVSCFDVGLHPQKFFARNVESHERCLAGLLILTARFKLRVPKTQLDIYHCAEGFDVIISKNLYAVM